MSEWVPAILVAALVISGALFCLLAAIGVLRFPDLFTRMHAASKAGILGSGLVLLGLALREGDSDLWIKSIATIVFFAVTSPLSAHLLASASRQAGQQLDVLAEKEPQNDR